MRALKDYTVYCQTTYEATAEGGMQKMVSLLSLTLEPTKDLVMLRVPEIIVVGEEEQEVGEEEQEVGEEEQEVGEEEQDDDNSPADPTDVKRRHADLTDTGRRTREAVNRALARRFLARYIGPGLTKRTHLFDHAMLLSPTMCRLGYIGTLARSTAGKAAGMSSESAIKARIQKEVVDLLTKAIIELRKRDAAAAAVAAAQDGLDAPTAKRAKTAYTAAEDQTRKDLRELGLLDGDDDEEDNPAPDKDRDPREEAEAMLKGWVAYEVSVRCARGPVG